MMRKLLTNITLVLTAAFLIVVTQPISSVQIDGSSVVKPLANGMET